MAHLAKGEAGNVGNLLKREARKIMHVHDAGSAQVNRLQLIHQ